MTLAHYSRQLPSASTVAPFQARMQLGTATRLDLVPAVGPLIAVEDDILVIDTSITLDLTDNLLTAAGADAGAAPAASALLYHVYVSNTQAFPFPLDLRLSLTAPTLVNGVAYLGAAGSNAGHWRHVGWIFTDATPNLIDTNARRQVVSRYNGLDVVQTMTPGYVDDNAADGVTLTSAVYALINAGVGDSFFFIGNGDAVMLTFTATARAVGAALTVVGLGVSANGAAAQGHVFGEFPALGAEVATAGARALQTTEGVLYQIQFLALTTGVATQFWSGKARDGLPNDPATLMASATIKV